MYIITKKLSNKINVAFFLQKIYINSCQKEGNFFYMNKYIGKSLPIILSFTLAFGANGCSKVDKNKNTTSLSDLSFSEEIKDEDKENIAILMPTQEAPKLKKIEDIDAFELGIELENVLVARITIY